MAGHRAINRAEGRQVFKAVRRGRVLRPRVIKPAGSRAIDRSKGRRVLKFEK